MFQRPIHDQRRQKNTNVHQRATKRHEDGREREIYQRNRDGDPKSAKK